MGCILYQVFLLYHIQHGKGGTASQVVSAESGSKLPVYWCKHWADEYACHRETIADAFCHGDDVGFDAVVLMGEELAAASVAALDFIENQDRVVFRTSLAESLHEFVCRQLDAAYTLYAFDNHCADISFGQFDLHGFDVVQREVGDVPAVVDGSDDFRIVRYFHRQ